MSKYSLIKQLHNPPTVETPLLPEGIRYQEYQIDPKDGTMTVFIPLREADAFEESLMEYSTLLRSDVRTLLRKHRGIIG
jgi:hypothetical protein